jgi:hypothetical protein
MELVNETLSYFRPISGTVVGVEEDKVTIDFGGSGIPRVGARLQAFSEGAKFVHPVTKEPLGKVEVPIGAVAVTSATPQETRGTILKGRPEDFAKATVKVPGTKVRVLFSQGNVEWHLGDTYYQALKETGRFELIDTGQERADIQTLLAEAREKGAELLLVLNAQPSPDQVSLTQQLVWSGDGTSLSLKSVTVDSAYMKELKLKATRFAVGGGDALLSFSLPFGSRRLTAGDFDGDGTAEIVLVSGKQLGVYRIGVDLTQLWEIKASFLDGLIWIEAADVNNDRKDEIIVTSFGGISASQFSDEAPVSIAAPPSGTTVTSHVFALRGGELVRIAVGEGLFLRASSRGLIGQKYSRANGYEGDVFSVTLTDGILKTGAPVKLPPGVNIYDFEHVTSPDGRQGIVAWDDNGYLNLYDDKGIRRWISKDSYGGFPMTFKRESPTVMVERGTWSVKDRLVVHLGELLAPRRTPLAGMVKGIGYRNSDLKGLWWNGISLDERTFIGPISGEILDFAVAGDRIAVLTKPLFGIKTENILKGQNPFGASLFLYSGK